MAADHLPLQPMLRGPSKTHRFYNTRCKLVVCPHFMAHVRRNPPIRPFGQEGGRVAGWFRYETKSCAAACRVVGLRVVWTKKQTGYH